MMRPDTLTVYRTTDWLPSPGGGQYGHRGWRWQLTASNGKIIGAATERYVRKEACIRNAARVLGIQKADLGIRSTLPRITEHPDIEVVITP